MSPNPIYFAYEKNLNGFCELFRLPYLLDESLELKEKRWSEAFRSNGGEGGATLRKMPSVLASLGKSTADNAYRLEALPLSPTSIIPVKDSGSAEITRDQAENLWNRFMTDVPNIKARKGCNEWLDAFDTLVLMYFSQVPSPPSKAASAPYSLYDRCRIDAAKAFADLSAIPEEMENALTERGDYLLLKGDFQGIQNFIFTSGRTTNKSAAKVLRGRSMYVSLLCESAILRILNELQAAPQNCIVNAAGQFLILWKDSKEAKESLEGLRKEFNRWSLDNTLGKTCLHLAWVDVNGAELEPFDGAYKKVNAELERIKLHPFDFLETGDGESQFDESVSRVNEDDGSHKINEGLCGINSDFMSRTGKKGVYKLRQEKDKDKDEDEYALTYLSSLSFDQVLVGKALTSEMRVLVSLEISRKGSDEAKDYPTCERSARLHGDMFGVKVQFHSLEKRVEATSGNDRLIFDIALPKENKMEFNGYPKRFYNTPVPRYTKDDQAVPQYTQRSHRGDEDVINVDFPKSMYHIACDNLSIEADVAGSTHRSSDNGANAVKQVKGIRALASIKGDVDNLGGIIDKALKKGGPEHFTCLSRTLDLFFTLHLPGLCRKEKEEDFQKTYEDGERMNMGMYPNTYTVFAGGDDFMLIGPVAEQMNLLKTMQRNFRSYVGENDGITFSAGIVLTGPMVNIYALTQNVESSLGKAKEYKTGCNDKLGGNPPKKKNAFHVFGETLANQELTAIMEQKLDKLEHYMNQYGLGTGFFHRVLQLVNSAKRNNAQKSVGESAKSMEKQIRDAMWYSKLAYMISRTSLGEAPAFANMKKEEKRIKIAKCREKMHKHLVDELENNAESFKVALFLFLYKNRKTNLDT